MGWGRGNIADTDKYDFAGIGVVQAVTGDIINLKIDRTKLSTYYDISNSIYNGGHVDLQERFVRWVKKSNYLTSDNADNVFAFDRGSLTQIIDHAPLSINAGLLKRGEYAYCKLVAKPAAFV